MKKFNKDVHITAKAPEDPSGLPARVTNRLRIDSWERSNQANGRAGDAIALNWMRPEAKAFIGWWDATDPSNPVCKAWIGAHDEANNPQAKPHRHFSVEVTDSDGHMQTRLGIPYDKDHTNITTNKADFTVNRGALRVPVGSHLEFGVGNSGKTGPRWEIRMSDDQSLELLFRESPHDLPRVVGRLDSGNGRLEIDTLDAGEMFLRDRSTGLPNRIYIDNGQICVEETK